MQVDVESRRAQVAKVYIAEENRDDGTGQAGIGRIDRTSHDVRASPPAEVGEQLILGERLDDVALVDLPVIDRDGRSGRRLPNGAGAELLGRLGGQAPVAAAQSRETFLAIAADRVLRGSAQGPA